MFPFKLVRSSKIAAMQEEINILRTQNAHLAKMKTPEPNNFREVAVDTKLGEKIVDTLIKEIINEYSDLFSQHIFDGLRRINWSRSMRNKPRHLIAEEAIVFGALPDDLKAYRHELVIPEFQVELTIT